MMYLFCLCCVFSLLGFVHLELGFCFFVGLLGAFFDFPYWVLCIYWFSVFSTFHWVLFCVYVIGFLLVCWFFFFFLLGFVVYIWFLPLSDSGILCNLRYWVFD